MIHWLRRQYHKYQTRNLIAYLKECYGMIDKPMPKEHFSLLLGSGFSVPASYPTASQLNTKLSTVKANQIWIADSFDAGFIEGPPQTGHADNSIKRMFVEKFLEFYLSKFPDFNYENFYDYYIQIAKGENEDKDYTVFYQSFVSTYGREYDERQMLQAFNRTFTQLIFSILYRFKDVKDGKVAGFAFGPYRAFNSFIEKLPFIAHIHTLNHDMLFEQMANTNGLSVQLSDGFEEMGSPYYGKPHNLFGKMVRTDYFNNKYDTQHRLYKLHGSVDYIPFSLQDSPEKTMIRIIHYASFRDLYKEVIDKKGKLKYEQCWINWVSDFLSGTTEKTRHYSDPHYYKFQFDHFKTNLSKSKYLLIIGYSFGDDEVNKMIDKFFLSRKDTKLVCMTPRVPDKFPKSPQAIHHPFKTEQFVERDIKTFFDLKY